MVDEIHYDLAYNSSSDSLLEENDVCNIERESVESVSEYFVVGREKFDEAGYVLEES